MTPSQPSAALHHAADSGSRVVPAVAGTDLLPRLIETIETVVVGAPDAVRLALTCLIARGHLLIEDLPGVGKTTLAQALATTLGLSFQRVQFTSDLLPADILGVSVFDARTSAFTFHPGPIFTSVLLADEINRAPPKTQSALLEAMEERQVSAEGATRPLPDPFFVIATQNPTEQAGVFPLPESQLDRFLLRISIGVPDAKAERELLTGGDRRALLKSMQPFIASSALRELQAEAQRAHASPALIDYVQALLAATRNQAPPGLSPRAGLMLLAAARAASLVAGRAYVLPEDVQAVFVPVAAHRLTHSRLGARGGDEIALEVLRSVAV
jgi:MoxR-like ATPase